MIRKWKGKKYLLYLFAKCFPQKKGAKFLTDCLYIEYSTYTYKLVFWVSFIGLFYNLHVKLFHFLADIFFHNENYGKKYCEKEKCCGK